MSNENRQRPAGRGMMGGRGGMRGPGEKAKDFTGTWKKLLLYCRRYFPFLAGALILAMAGAICSLIGPDKLKDLTNLITQGLTTEIDMEGVKRIAFGLAVL